MNRPLRIAALLSLATLALAACGKKADLRPPDGEEATYTYPQPYPTPRSVVPGGETAGEYPPVFVDDRSPDEGRTKRVVTGPS